MNSDDPVGSRSIRTLDRAVAILDLFRDNHELTMSEVCKISGLSEPTVFRYLTALMKHEWLVRESNGAFRLGIAMFELGQQAVANLDVHAVARSHMEALRDRWGETINLAIRQGDILVVIESLEGPSSIRRGASTGEQDLWFSSGLGKSILAQLPEDEVRRLHGEADLEPLTERTITTLTGLFAELAESRRRGFSVDNEESELGLMCVASAVHDRMGNPRYALSVSGPAERIRMAMERDLGDSVAQTATAIARNLGHDGSERLARQTSSEADDSGNGSGGAPGKGTSGRRNRRQAGGARRYRTVT